ncbi:MAG: hypothetical protein A2Y12_03885 [Planctomycetes bacterium GWF2_42_9]|nr:MAG: hypothetical protein A2Y12_03885 [Planctomycetes bacterium GWF2_42_9]HAL45695.1 hypothetical protein [Phycisphaerales bacterium]
MKKMEHKNVFENLPLCAVEYIKLIIKKMKWRKKVREDVQAELIAHFEDALHDCKTNEEKEKAAKELIANFGDAGLIAVLARRAKKRCRPMWQKAIIRCFQAFGIFIIFLILYCFYIASGKPTLRVNYIQEYINANRPVSDESQNAESLYKQIGKVYVKPPEINDANDHNNYAGGKIDLLDKIKHIRDFKQLNDEQFAMVDKWIEDNNETIKLFIEASKRPYCWHEPNASELQESFIAMLMPNLSSTRNAVYLLTAKARLKAYKGNMNEALQCITPLWDASGHFSGPRTIIEQLVGLSIEGLSFKAVSDLLAEYKFSPEQLKMIQSRLEKLLADNDFYMNYGTERFFVRDFIQRCYTDDGRGNGHAIPDQLSQFWGNFGEYDMVTDKKFRGLLFLGMSVLSEDRKEMTEFMEHFYEKAQQYAKMTPWQLHKENKSLESMLTNWSRYKSLRYMNARMLLPAFDKANTIPYRYQITGKSLIVTIAVFRYQQDNNKLPESLKQLQETGYICSIPIDPFSGNEITYKLTKDEFTIYSFGFDFDDDGGKIGVNNQGKSEMWNTDDGDAVFWPVGETLKN